MKRLTNLEYLELGKWDARFYKLRLFFSMIPSWFQKLGVKIGGFFRRCASSVRDEGREIGSTFAQGNWAVKLSFFIFGVGNLYYGQVLRGVLFLLFQVIFITYMFLPSGGIYWLQKGNWFQTGATVGTSQGGFQYDELYDTSVWVPGDDSVKVMLYGLLTLFFIVAFLYTWRLQVKQCRICMEITSHGKKVKSAGEDLKSLLDDQFHKTLLALPLTGILVFTVIPIIYMILVAFTSYDANHDGYSNLFSWVGLSHFNELFRFGEGGLGLAFGEILSWTLMWAFFATFSNYFLGMLVAIIINRKGIRFKRGWRTILVLTIAVPQFVSLLYVSRLFSKTGIIGKLLIRWNLLPTALTSASQWSLWDNPTTARILLILVNIWIGIPYIMLMATGILMNIPKDLYESARIDGANTWQQYTKITLPYMLFVTGPYLLTSFVGNLNNFNVIFLLTGGNPLNSQLGAAGGASVGHTDLLITWLYKMTLDSGESKYYMASLVGILVFVVVAVLSLVVYHLIPSTRNEEDFG